MAVALDHRQFDRHIHAGEKDLRRALAELAPSWLARSAGPFQELIIAPANDLSRHILSHWPEQVGPARSLLTVSRHIETEVERLGLPTVSSPVGPVLADGAAAAFAETPPLVGYDLTQGCLLPNDSPWNYGDPALLLVGAAALSQVEMEEYLRLKEEAAAAPLSDQTLNELMQWQKELATMKASLQASLMQGVDPMALGDILQSLKGLMTQSAALRSVIAIAKKQPDEARYHGDVRKQTVAVQNLLEKLVSSGKLPPDVSMKLLGMLNRLTRTLSDKPVIAQSGLMKTLLTKMAIRKDGVQRLPQGRAQLVPTKQPGAAVATAFRKAAGATVIRFPLAAQAQQRLTGIAAMRRPAAVSAYSIASSFQRGHSFSATSASASSTASPVSTPAVFATNRAVETVSSTPQAAPNPPAAAPVSATVAAPAAQAIPTVSAPAPEPATQKIPEVALPVMEIPKPVVMEAPLLQPILPTPINEAPSQPPLPPQPVGGGIDLHSPTDGPPPAPNPTDIVLKTGEAVEPTMPPKDGTRTPTTGESNVAGDRNGVGGGRKAEIAKDFHVHSGGCCGSDAAADIKLILEQSAIKPTQDTASAVNYTQVESTSGMKLRTTVSSNPQEDVALKVVTGKDNNISALRNIRLSPCPKSDGPCVC